jgi:hypothetical protein
VKPSTKGTLNCCLDLPWYAWWYGTGWNADWQEPWYDFSAALPNGFGSPVNVPADLSLHVSSEEGYWPGKTWDWNYYFDEHIPTDDILNPWSFMPTTWHPDCSADKANDTGSGKKR